MIKAYIVKHKNFEIRINSRSGGIFTLLSDYFLENQGVVYGAILDDKLNVIHTRATTKEERDLMRGSKYAQSFLGDTFIDVKNDVAKGNNVLFTGTPCQIAGLKNVIIDDLLFTVDIVCHGVPSHLIYKEYIKFLENKYNSKVLSFNFRNKKKYGWDAHYESVKFDNGKEIDSDNFRNLFYEHKVLRPSCFTCNFKNLNRISDITIADAWGVDKDNPKFNDNNGISLVFVNTDKGQKVFDSIKGQMEYIEVDVDTYLQPPLKMNYEEPRDRNKFWERYHKKGFEKTLNIENRKRLIRNVSIKIKRKLGL